MTERRQKFTLITALVAGVGSAAGGATKAVLDAGTTERLQVTVAERAALADEKFRRLEGDVAALGLENQRLRESVAILRVTAGMLAQGRRDKAAIEDTAAAAEIDVPPPRPKSIQSPAPPPPDVVQQYRKELFK